VHPLEKHWQRLTWASLLLLPLALVFAVVTGARRLLYRGGVLRAVHLPVPVIVVGNIVAGGAGKTPLVVFLAEALRARGLRPGIVSRGYGGRETLAEVRPDSSPAEVGDEPVLLCRRARCPVWVGRDRVAAALALLAAHPECDVIVSDDGLQHYRLARDIEIAVFDPEQGLGNGLPLPAGPLREPASRLTRVDAVVTNGPGEFVAPGAPCFDMRLEGETLRNLRDPSLGVAALAMRGAAVHAVAGIGRPARFFAHLRRFGLTFVEHPFPDHHPFVPSDFDFAPDGVVVMTEKDGIKCGSFARDNWWTLPVEARVDPALVDRILQRLKTNRGRQAH